MTELPPELRLPPEPEVDPEAAIRLEEQTRQAKAVLAEDPEEAFSLLVSEFEEIPAGVKTISLSRKKNKTRTVEVPVRPLRPRLSQDKTDNFELLAEACATMADVLVARSEDDESLWQARLLYEEAVSLEYEGYSPLLADPAGAGPEAIAAFNRASESAVKRIDTFRGKNLPAHEEESINRMTEWADRIGRPELLETRKLLHTVRTEIRMKRYEDHPIKVKKSLLQEAGDQLKRLLPWGEPITEVDQRAAFALKEGLERLEGIPAKQKKRRSAKKS